MHILITGGRGQLGSALHGFYKKKSDVRLTVWNRPEFDVADPAISAAVADARPNVVINTAAWTNVDGAESEPDAAFAANALGPKYLAEGCRHCGAALVQVSTNEVFAGEPEHVYYEYDEPSPKSIYARSKRAGEVAAMQMLDRLYIVRVAWLFGSGGNNFPSKMIGAADKFGALRVVADEYGNPTYAPDAAQAVSQLIKSERYGTYHIVNDGTASRFELAQATLRGSGRGDVPLTPIPASKWPRPASPPLHAVLANQAAAALGITLRGWPAALVEYLETENLTTQT